MALARVGWIEIARRAGAAAGVVSFSALWVGSRDWTSLFAVFVAAPTLGLVLPVRNKIALPEDGFPGIKTFRKSFVEAGNPVAAVSVATGTCGKRKDQRRCT